MKILPNTKSIFQVVSELQTPDGTILVSANRHDYKQYQDKNGKMYMIDGGLDYVRSSVNGDEKMIALYNNSSHEQLREYIGRSGHGKDGNEEYRFALLKDMSDEWVKASIPYLEERTPKDNEKAQFLIKLYRKELRYRKENNISIKDETI